MKQLLKLNLSGFIIVLVLCLLSVVVGCGRLSHPVTPSETLVLSTALTSPIAKPTLPPTCCYGMFVTIGESQLSADYIVQPYIVGDPITVTTTVLVFDEGRLRLPTGRFLNGYTLSVTDRQGHQLPMTAEGKRWTKSGDNGTTNRVFVERNSPHTVAFRIDEWFDFSHTGVYTLTVGREAWIGDTSQIITGNTVLIFIRPASAPACP